MAYQTIRDLVSHIRSLHRRLREEVREAQARAEDAEDERYALLLSVIDEHESTLEQAVARAEREGGEGVLDTWLQFEPNVETERAMRQADSAPSSTSHRELLTHVLETENAIMRLYDLLRGSTGSASVQSFFAGLLQIQDSAVRRSARMALEAHDV